VSDKSFKISNDLVTWYARMLVQNEPDFSDFFQLKQINSVNVDVIHARFVKFHTLNPHIYQLFRRFAHEVQQSGHTRYSADAIMHRIRWEHDITFR